MLAEEKLIRSSDTIDFWLTISSVKQKNHLQNYTKTYTVILIPNI